MDDFPFSDAQYISPQSPFGTHYSDFHHVDSSLQQFCFASPTQEDSFGRYGHLSYSESLPIPYDSSNAHTPHSAFSQSSVTQSSPNSLDWADAEAYPWPPNDGTIYPDQRHIRGESNDRQITEYSTASALSHREDVLASPRQAIPAGQPVSRDPQHVLATSYRELRPVAGDMADLPSPVLSPGDLCETTSGEPDRAESKREVSASNKSSVKLHWSLPFWCLYAFSVSAIAEAVS